ncbi:arylsulfatase [Gayadomonas joobiniege]|uniref:arylsulfatase n=1 Tax=Gayadomonas joobiniege TaxID=1234606 RepID=UPI000377F058|nr:arylsulfatase [Gayadomonas joobiniege]
MLNLNPAAFILKSLFNGLLAGNAKPVTFKLGFIFGLVLFLNFFRSAEVLAASHKKLESPNVIYIIVDDMGIGDISPYGQEKIRTPNLQKMADEGLTFTQHYAGSTVCAPSRASVITGLHSGHSQIRGNFELGGFTDDKEYGQMPLDPGTPTIATVMKEAGYKTALIGKWGLGGPGSHGEPTKHGFDYFFGYLDQKQAHNHFPTHLWRNTNQFPLGNAWLDPHQTLPGHVDKNDPASYRVYQRDDFAQERLTQDALNYIKTHKDGRFFMYLAYAGPHAALQAPQDLINEYNFDETPYTGETHGNYVPQLKPRAARAAMITHIDQGVGRLLDLLKDLNIDKDTLIIFTSDNGPSFEGGADLDFFNSNAKYRGYKRDLYEGGIRMPTIARWPGKVAAGVKTDHLSAFWDLMPTLAELTGVSAPKNTDGISFLPTLLGSKKMQAQHTSLYWEFHQGKRRHIQAVRINDDRKAAWKALRTFDKNHRLDPPVELYDLKTDPGEQNNLASEYPEVVAQAKQLMQSSRTRSTFEYWNFDYLQPAN